MLVEMNRRRARTAIRPVVLARERIHGILPEITLLGGQLHRFARCFGKSDLIKPDGTIHVKQNAAGILADRLRLLFRQRDVPVNDFQRALGNRAFLFLFQRREDGLVHVIGDFG